jgi:hypothetical protein
VAVPIAAVIAAFFLLRGCGRDPVPEPTPTAQEALFVPADLARLKGLDRDGVIDYCRTQIRPANYEGILRGAHGALWAGEANAWDRVLLAVAALEGAGVEARIVPGEPPRLTYFDKNRWHSIRLDAEAPVEESAQPPPGAVVFGELAVHHLNRFHSIEPVLVLEGEEGIERIAAARPERVAEWTSMPVVLKTMNGGTTVRYSLRVGERTVLESGALVGCRRASLEMTWRYQDRSLIWARELFDRENAKPGIPGNDTPDVGNRYAIVLAAGPLVPEVLQTRIRMFELPGYTPVADETERELLTLGTKYHVDCDERTLALAAETKVEVAWNSPRIVIAASEAAPRGPAGLSLDALADAVEAKGKRNREFHVARGLATDLIESRIIFEARRLPVVSASTVFSNFKASSPDAPARRIALIESEAKRLLAHELIGATVKLEALPPPAPSDDAAANFPASPLFFLERTKEGITLRGLTESMPEPEKPWTKYRWEPEGRSSFGDRVAELSRVADALLCRHTRRADFLLKCTAASAWPLDSLPVLAGSFLDYTMRDGKKEQKLGVRIGLKDGLPTNGKVQLAAGWPMVNLPGKPGAMLAPRELLAKGEAVKVKVRVGESEREVAARKVALESGASVTLLDSPTFPLVLAWEQGTTSLSLATASPVVQGRILDRETGAPAPASVAIGRVAKPVMLRKPLDLRAFKPQGPEKGGNWKLAADGLSVLQTSSYYPTFFVSPEDVFETTVRGTIEVTDAYVRYPIGFVLGYRSPLADKGHKDTNFDCLWFNWEPAGRTSPEGFTLARLNGTFDGGTTNYAPFDDLKKRPGFEVLATRHAKGTGWLPKIEYQFEATYRKDSVRISIDGQEVINVKGTFTPGRFGFYSYWQANVRYRLLSPQAERVEPAAETGETLPVAADGSYALSAAPTAPRLILILDRSGSMHLDLNPKQDGRDTPAKAGEQRMDHLKKEVRELLDKLPPGVEVALWSFASAGFRSGGTEPNDTRVDCPFTTDLGRLRTAVDALKPAGGTPITGAVIKLLDHVRNDPLSRDAVAVFLTDGQNDSRDPTGPDAYRQGRGKTAIHTIGFAIAPASLAEKEMQDLARVSGGTYHLAGTGEALKFAFDQFRTTLLDVRLKVTSPCHAGEERDLKSADLGRGKQDFALTHGCTTCRCEDKTFLTVTNKNVKDMDKCEALSPKARRMIEGRVKDGAWTVTIPTARVNVGPISAYGWFETETATGRLIGRTEDGLHGSVAAPGSFPEAVFRGGHAFLSWFQGIVSYTTGSVDAAFKWNKQPGFLTGGSEGFKRFVQANALQFAARWWNEFGWAAYPESIHAYWTGVCLNFTLQSMAFEMPSLDCYRRWGEALCKQIGDKAKGLPGNVLGSGVGGPLNKEFDDALGNYLASVKAVGERLIERAADKKKAQEEVDGLVGSIEKWKQDLIDRPIDARLDCEQRFR